MTAVHTTDLTIPRIHTDGEPTLLHQPVTSISYVDEQHAFQILSCKEIRPSTHRGAALDTAEINSFKRSSIYDIQKYKSVKARTTAAEAVAGVQNKSVYRSTRLVFRKPQETQPENKSNKNLLSNSKVASAMADAAAEATAGSVLRDVNKGAMTPPLNSISMPKLKSNQGGKRAKTDQSYYKEKKKSKIYLRCTKANKNEVFDRSEESIVGIVAAAEDGNAIVEQEQDEEKEQGDPKREPLTRWMESGSPVEKRAETKEPRSEERNWIVRRSRMGRRSRPSGVKRSEMASVMASPRSPSKNGANTTMTTTTASITPWGAPPPPCLPGNIVVFA
ncbi:hypothetical protein F3Y22_tig00000218pilonHSYRG00252 [Hibiscus syriacus]|uniref:Uncharacterized protein n=1 Tax=Hibiscus syriacus TaxID=106335 RepID=A0A6A3D2Q1_HIBSY|nr:hypothetical protein F3Y22_tig00000218pilonHSYRG00252 [Hibiscus syriacus]